MKLDDLPTNDDIDAGTWGEVLPGESTSYSGTFSVHDGARDEAITNGLDRSARECLGLSLAGETR